MKLCFIASHLFTGGFTSSLLNMMEACLKKGYEVDLLLLEEEKNEPGYTIDHRVNILHCNTVKHSRYDVPLILRLKRQKKEYERLLGLIDSANGIEKTKLQMEYYQRTQLDYVCNNYKSVDFRKYDAVISWEEILCDYFLAFKVRAKKKIAYIHPDYALSFFCEKIDEKMISRVDYVAGVSKATVTSIKQIFPKYLEKFVCVTNPLNINQLEMKILENKSYKINDSFTILTVSRLDIYHKGFDRLVRVAKQLEEQGYAFEWYVCGDGVDRKRIERMIEEADPHHLHLLGNQVNPYPFMKQADVFVLLSNYEGKPVVVDEAMYLDLPCIVTNYDSAMEQIEDGVNGFVVPMDDEACFKAIEKVITDSCVRDVFKENLRKQDKKKYADISSFIKLIEK